MSNILTNNINPRSGNTINIGGVNTKVSIAGTLTYEDVTSVDSVGVITAQSGVVVSGGGINVTGVSTFNDDIRVSSGQSIGIGTTALFAIHVKGDSTDNANDREIRIDASASGLGGQQAGIFRVWTGGASAASKYMIGYGDEHPSQTDELSLKNGDGPIKFYSNNTTNPAMCIGQRSNAGAGSSVGIGTTRPAADLDLAGNMEFNGAEVGGFLTEDIPSDAIRTYHMGTDMGLKLRGGLMMITAYSNISAGDYGFYSQPIGSGLVYVDCGKSVSTPLVLAEAATGLLGSTSSSTTITDFTDNRVTIVALTDQIRIVNRISSARAFKLHFM